MTLIDLSHPICNETPVYPGDISISLAQTRSYEKHGFVAHSITTGFHAGTHIDAPMHLTNDNKTIADFPLDHFIGKGVLLDVREESHISMKPHYQSIIEPNSIVLLHTDFDQFYHTDTNKYYTQHPIVDEQLTEFFITRKIKILGMDMPSPDKVPFAAHKTLLSNGIFILENLTNLRFLLGLNNFEIIAFPLKISAEASLVRVVCRPL